MSFNGKSFVFVPLVFFILLPVGFFICYGVAVSLHHVPQLPKWPFVSDTGAYPPESCIFTLFLTWGAFLLLVIMVAHYKYVLHHGHVTKCNTAGLIVGTISTFGITMVGSFQWAYALIPHVIGAFMAFFGAAIYSWINVYISWKYMLKNVYGRGIVYCRTVIAIIESLSLLLLLISFPISSADRSKFFNFATISEWLLIYSALIFIVTMVYDLNNIRYARINLVLHSNQNHQDEENSVGLPLSDVQPNSLNS